MSEDDTIATLYSEQNKTKKYRQQLSIAHVYVYKPFLTKKTQLSEPNYIQTLLHLHLLSET